MSIIKCILIKYTDIKCSANTTSPLLLFKEIIGNLHLKVKFLKINLCNIIISLVNILTYLISSEYVDNPRDHFCAIKLLFHR